MHVKFHCIIDLCRSSGAYGGIPPIAEKDERGRKVLKQPIPVWPEWTDQDIASEKWVM